MSAVYFFLFPLFAKLDFSFFFFPFHQNNFFFFFFFRRSITLSNLLINSWYVFLALSTPFNKFEYHLKYITNYFNHSLHFLLPIFLSQTLIFLTSKWWSVSSLNPHTSFLHYLSSLFIIIPFCFKALK